ncbi:MAG: hypothetical protein Q4G64_05750 [bacterium]|nr:hypothetical protein [bacterium]
MYSRENKPDFSGPDYPESAPRGVPPWELEEVPGLTRRRNGSTRIMAAITAAAMLIAIAVPAFLVLETRMGRGSSVVFFAIVGLGAAAMVQFLRRREDT